MSATQLSLLTPPKPTPATISSYHVRSETPLAEALAGEARCRTQEAILLAWLRAQPGKRFTPSEVHASFDHWPLTSCRRALTNLAKRGDLIHHAKERRPGPYGSPESVWSHR